MEEQSLTKKELYDAQKEAKKNKDGAFNAKLLKRLSLWVFVLVVMGGSIWGLSKIAKQPPADSDSSGGAQIATVVLPSDWVTGNKEAKTVLIEYSDFQCPACRAYYPLVKKLIADHGDSFQFVYRHFPLSQHANAKPAAYAAEAAGKQGKFWEMEDMIFVNQTAWSNSKNASNIFLEYARSLELNIDQFKKDRDSSETKNKVNEDYQSGIKARVNATPTFYLNGKRIQPSNYDEFSNFIKQAQDSDLK